MPIALITRDKYGRDGLARRVDGLPIRRFPRRGEGCGGTAPKTEQGRAQNMCGVTLYHGCNAPNIPLSPQRVYYTARTLGPRRLTTPSMAECAMAQAPV